MLHRAGGTTVDTIPNASVSSALLVVQVEYLKLDQFDGCGLHQASMVAYKSSEDEYVLLSESKSSEQIECQVPWLVYNIWRVMVISVNFIIVPNY